MSGTDPKTCPEPREFSFATFVISLSTAALQHLGLSLGQGESPPEVNLPLAQQTIDILDMLQRKTQGNLSEEESRLLLTILYDLRMRYVQVARGAGC